MCAKAIISKDLNMNAKPCINVLVYKTAMQTVFLDIQILWCLVHQTVYCLNLLMHNNVNPEDNLKEQSCRH